VSQHVPIASQVFGAQVPPNVHVCAPGPQADCATNQHAPVMKLQQRPIGTHGLEKHPLPEVQTLGEGQSDAMTTEQVRLAVQHVPAAGQGFGVQETEPGGAVPVGDGQPPVT
jgi:hypothetical protein